MTSPLIQSEIGINEAVLSSEQPVETIAAFGVHGEGADQFDQRRSVSREQLFIPIAAGSG